MRKKNRQLKLTIDIPESYQSDEIFMMDLRDQLDADGWNMCVAEDGFEVDVSVSKVTLGDIEIEPEEKE